MNRVIDKNFFKKLYKVAAKETLMHFRKSMDVDNKEKIGFDPVTIADKNTENALRQFIASHFPDDQITGEEFGTQNEGAEYCWIIDPIDGTRSYICGMPVWGTLVGLYHHQKAIAGAMIQPYIGEIFYATGQGSFLQHRLNDCDEILHTSTCRQLDRARLFTTQPELFKGESALTFDRLKKRVELVRYGADCYAFAMLAAGHIDVVIETGLHIYDIAALIPIIEQAGGIITNWSGGPAEKAGNIIACANRDLHNQIIECLNPA